MATAGMIVYCLLLLLLFFFFSSFFFFFLPFPFDTLTLDRVMASWRHKLTEVQWYLCASERLESPPADLPKVYLILEHKIMQILCR